MSSAKPLIFIVDDEPAILGALERLFKSDFEIRTFTDADSALQALEKEDPALVLTDSIMPKMNGLEFLKHVRSKRPNTVRALLSGQVGTDDLSMAINTGLLHRFFIKPWESQVLKLQLLECIQQRKILMERDYLESLAVTDPVTGLGNHRFFQDQIRIEVERARRHQRQLSLIMMDIDQFKDWNDRFGHPAGDLLLKQLAVYLQKSLRQIDSISRYGGDEFAILLPETNSENAHLTAERLRNSFSSAQSNQGPEKVSFSIGVATYPLHASDGKSLIEVADKALYQAKHQGRNQSVIAGPQA